MNCIKCGREHHDYHFRVLQIQTLHIRDIKERRVQALGEFEEYGICDDCARAKYEQYMDNGEVLKKTSLPYALLLLVGAVVAALFRGDTPILALGIGMMICGITCLYGNVHNRSAKKRELSALSREEGLYNCAWESLLDAAPKKDGDNDITYIPVDEKTLARKNGDLMILYDLLPEIAIEAHKRIHADAE